MDNHRIHLHYFDSTTSTMSTDTNIKNHTFRDYTKASIDENIRNTYKLARTHQNIAHVENMHQTYLRFQHKMHIHDVFDKLATFVDISDPDITMPNFYHGLQTAESIRMDGHPEWLQLVGLIHDVGKIMYLWGCDDHGTTIEKQWGIVGDTFVVGCALPETIVYPEYNALHPDKDHPDYCTKHGIYKPHCGLDNVLCSWGHDEYLYQVLKHNKCPLPEQALYIIRFHSLYAHHRERSYNHLMDKKDHDMLHWLRLFNKYDLYTKTNDESAINENTRKYYDTLVDKYLNGGVLWF